MLIKRKTASSWISKDSTELSSLRAQLDAIGKAQALLECRLDGTIVSANENFLRLMGYDLSELQGQHHNLLSGGADSAIWDKLGRGQVEVSRFKRLAKGGRVVWLRGSYSPVMNAGSPPA